MAEFKITRFRYIWKGDWSTSVLQYNKDDVVYYQGSAWVCIRQHEPTVFGEDIAFTPPGDTLPAPAWVKMVDGKEFLGEWSNGQRYDPGVLIIAGGNVYLCLVSHTSSSNFNNDFTNWELFAVGSNFRNQWLPSTRYRVGDVIRYNGYTYQCILEHESSTSTEGIIVGVNDDDDEPLSNDSTSETWKIVVENYSYVGEYQNNFKYRKNDLVKYGGSILKCIFEHTSPANQGEIENDRFVTYLSGFNYSNEWNSVEYYAIGDVVKYGGVIYVATENNFNSQPGSSALFELGNPTWNIITKGQTFVGEYDPQGNVRYKEGDIIRRGGALWISLIDQQTDNSSLRPLDTSNWELVIAAQNFRGSWKVDTDYNLYDTVYYKGIVYYATVPHFSDFQNFPGDNGSGFNYWAISLISNENAALTNLGDLLTYNLQRNIIEDGSTSFVIGDESTLGPTNIKIGTTDQVLVINDNEGNIGYKTWGNIQRVFHVRTNGVDDDTDPDRGINYFKPFRTLRFALEKADDGFEGFTTIKVSTGEYQEVLPLIIPKRTAVVGEELRSTTIRANDPIPGLINDATYTLETLVRIGLLLSDILQGNDVEKTPGNSIIQNTDLSINDSLTIENVNDLWSNVIDVINYKVNDQGSMPVVTGSNVETNNVDKLNAILILENNRNFIKEEAIAWMAQENPEYVFNTDKCRRDLDRFINAVQYDLRYPGNYKSVLAGRYYANAVIGSQLEDMFYVRDTTGIRNMTLKGLEGTLPALQAGQTYRIPTGGSFVSLDPGWGPNDERTWIINRSCYVQNVTTFGTGAVGQKIDGLLHNGGNRSIVSNDFTQVISDGIGAWVQNGGRAELVSVFTYYAHIGMFAKDGGIIRATNGNSSYGDFGAVADGIDPGEEVRFAKINTRSEQAIVASAFAGEILDFILGLEFQNCGQQYTQATYNFVSSGTGAEAIQEEFRDNAMFECQVPVLGSGLNLYGNQAQTGDTTTITLAAAEFLDEEDILGMRIIIISGEGTGQYGYIHDYNPGTKVVQVRKETTGEPGWDHILPGTEIRPLLTTGTRYRIEPRIEFSSPEESSQEYFLTTSNTWSSAVYGETSGVFSNIEGNPGTGTTLEALPALSLWNVVKSGRSYTVTLSNGGAGYTEGDVIIIDGADVGGVTGVHDIEIEVLTVSNDSTNSILTWRVTDETPIADSGKFILAPSSGHFGRWSSDGEDWTSFDFPSDGNWKCLAAGDNKFVAIVNGSNQAASSNNGVDWVARTMPASRNWNAVEYGKDPNGGTNQGVFLAVAGNLNAGAYSTNGINWTSVTMPVAGDSAFNEWVDVAYGFGKFVVLANSNNIVANMQYNSTTNSWTKDWHIMDAVADSSSKDWVSIDYGNRRFVAIASTGEVAYSFDGESWASAVLPTQDGSTRHNWKKIKYGQGVFMAIGDTGGRTVGADPTTGPSDFVALSYDGIVWRTDNVNTATPQSLGVLAFGNPDISLDESTVSNSRPMFIIAPDVSSTSVIRYFAGAKILGRIVVEGTGVAFIKIWEPGSGYTSTPDVTITDPKWSSMLGSGSSSPEFRFRFADGVLAQPTFITKGSAYKTSTTFVTVSGDGFADITPVGRFITVDNLDIMPGPGAQFYIGNREDYFTAVIVGINEQTMPNGKIKATFQVSPRPTLNDFLEHDMQVLIRERYSQVRITGHDFLDIGTGNFEETNYPELYKNFDFTTEPFQEVQNLNGGRVFYTSTDQDGNFRAGELFAVEQATGIITISADFFDLQGLTELRLGGIQVGSTAVIREFSKDPLFLQDSNNIIPTQRAIRSYLQSRLNIGGEDLLTPSIIAGTVKVGPNLIESSAGLTIDIPVLADFSGSGSGISGSILAQTMFYRSFGFGLK